MALRRHLSGRSLGAQEAALEVDVDQVVPVRICHVEELTRGKTPALLIRMSIGRVRDAFRNHAPGIVAAGDVTLHDQRAASLFAAEVGAGLGSRFVVEKVEGNVGAFAGQRDSGGPADSLLCARHEGDASPQIHVRDSKYRRPNRLPSTATLARRQNDPQQLYTYNSKFCTDK